jgi:hypothetical protein
MNERIEKLAIECYQAPEFDYKKFAELIVRECAQVGFDYADGHCCEISAVILEHFGVEE